MFTTEFPSNCLDYIVVQENTTISWTEADIYCTNVFNSSLASIHDESEEIEIADAREFYNISEHHFWIGGYGDCDNFSWVDGSLWDYDS